MLRGYTLTTAERDCLNCLFVKETINFVNADLYDMDCIKTSSQISSCLLYSMLKAIDAPSETVTLEAGTALTTNIRAYIKRNCKTVPTIC